MQIAIVGTGISGLTLSWLANEGGHDVTVFESERELGMNSKAIPVACGDFLETLDVPPRMFNEIQWPNIVRLYKRIGVKFEPIDSTKSFASVQGNTRLMFSSKFAPRLDRQLLALRTWKILNDIRRLKKQVEREFLTLSNEISTSEFLSKFNYSKEFIYDFFYPAISSTLFTCTYNSLDAYPAKILLESCLKLLDPNPLMRTTNGTSDVVNRLANGIDDLRLSTCVTELVDRGEKIELASDSGGVSRIESFDHVVIATQANSAIRLAPVTQEREKQILGQFHYDDVVVTVHSDVQLMPKNKWSAFNFLSTNEHAFCTIWMNRFCPEKNLPDPVFQTIGFFADVAPAEVLSRASFQRPVVNQASLEAQSLLSSLQDRDANRRIWYCGSYAGYGVPLLESGVVSALEVAKHLSIKIPACFV